MAGVVLAMRRVSWQELGIQLDLGAPKVAGVLLHAALGLYCIALFVGQRVADGAHSRAGPADPHDLGRQRRTHIATLLRGLGPFLAGPWPVLRVDHRPTLHARKRRLRTVGRAFSRTMQPSRPVRRAASQFPALSPLRRPS